MAHKGKMLDYRGRKVKIDAEIVPLISKLWRLEIDTQSSCQAICDYHCKHKVSVEKKGKWTIDTIVSRNPNCFDRIWIMFPAAEDFCRFLDFVAVYDTGKRSMYQSIIG